MRYFPLFYFFSIIVSVPFTNCYDKVINEVTCSFERSCDGWRESMKNRPGPLKLLFRNKITSENFRNLNPPKGLTGNGYVMAYSDTPVEVVLASPSFSITETSVKIKTDIFMSTKFEFQIDLFRKVTNKKGKEVDIAMPVYQSQLNIDFQADKWFTVEEDLDLTALNAQRVKLVFKANVKKTEDILAIKNLLVVVSHPDDIATTTKLFPSLETVPSTLNQARTTVKDVDITSEYTNKQIDKTTPCITTKYLGQKTTVPNDFDQGTQTTTTRDSKHTNIKDQDKTTIFTSTKALEDYITSTTEDINQGTSTNQDHEQTTMFITSTKSHGKNEVTPSMKTSTYSPDNINKGTPTNNYHDQTTTEDSKIWTSSTEDNNRGTPTYKDYDYTTISLTYKYLDSRTTAFTPEDQKQGTTRIIDQGQTTIITDNKAITTTPRKPIDPVQTTTITNTKSTKTGRNYQNLARNKKPFFKNDDGSFKGLFYISLTCFFGIILTVTIVGAGKTLKQQRLRREMEALEKLKYYRLSSTDSQYGVSNVAFVV